MHSHSSAPVPVISIRSILLLAVLAATSTSAQQRHDDHDHERDHGEEFEQHRVHEHGKVTFNVALDGQQLVVELDAPAANVIGFEHAPRTDAEKDRVRDQASWLQSGKALVSFPAAAACRFREMRLDAPSWQQGDTHADYEVRLTYRCDQPQRLDWLQLSLLAGLQGVHEARVNLVTPARQASDTITSAHTRVRLR